MTLLQFLVDHYVIAVVLLIILFLGFEALILAARGQSALKAEQTKTRHGDGARTGV